MFKFFYPLIRFVLFKMDPEKTHDLTLTWLKRIENSIFRWLLVQPVIEDPVEVFGIKFPNRVGLAAGLDKNGSCIDAFSLMGFGHIEIGTVTPRAQDGNPKPRLFRLVKSQALINRFGFNNKGVDHLVENVKAAKYRGVLGINIGKNFDTPVEKATRDYLICLEKVYRYASYVTVNISSPNTANLRALQFGKALEELLLAIKEKQAELTLQYSKEVPILIKIAPDLSDDEIAQLADTFTRFEVDGVIATNTTFSRTEVEGQKFAGEQGGLSGLPVLSRSNSVVRRLYEDSGHSFPIIGVGGIFDGKGASDKIKCGASLVQIYSGFIFRGPSLITEISKALAQK
jgi:dihydroorotate dehydrogenase